MSTNNFFDIKRTWMLIKRIFYVNKNMILGGLAVYSGLMLLAFILYLYNYIPALYFRSYVSTSLNIIVFWGIIYYMGKIVSDIHKPNKATSYLILPVSNFERFLSLWLTCSILFTFAGVILNYIVINLGLLIKPDETFIFKLASYKLQAFRIIFIQTIFFAGTVFFKKNQFLKVVLTFIIIWILIILVMGLIFFKAYFGMSGISTFNYNLIPSASSLRFYDVFVSYIIPVGLLTFTYFRLKGKEV